MVKSGLIGAVIIALIIISTNVSAQVYDGHKAITVTIQPILKNDHKMDAANELFSYYQRFVEGTMAAQNDFASREHFYNPDTGRGWMGFKDSKTLVTEEFAYAVNYKVDGELSKAYYHLGIVAHLIEDIAIPQHTTDDASNGHDQYENGLKDLQAQYFVTDGGYYNFTTIDALFTFVANQSHALIGYVDASTLDNNYTHVAEIMTPIAQRAVAGAVYLFFESADEGKIEVGSVGFSSGDIGVVFMAVMFLLIFLILTRKIWGGF